MKVDFRFRSIEARDELREHAMRRIQFHLSRFGDEITAVLLRIADINGPRGGEDKRCQVTVQGPKIGTIILDDLDSSPFSSVDLAVARAGRTVGRTLERARGERRRGLAHHTF